MIQEPLTLSANWLRMVGVECSRQVNQSVICVHTCLELSMLTINPILKSGVNSQLESNEINGFTLFIGIQHGLAVEHTQHIL